MALPFSPPRNAIRQIRIGGQTLAIPYYRRPYNLEEVLDAAQRVGLDYQEVLAYAFHQRKMWIQDGIDAGDMDAKWQLFNWTHGFDEIRNRIADLSCEA